MNVAPSLVREIAESAGFDLVRFGPADPGEHGARFEAWLDAGRAGEMDYLRRNRARIVDPRRWATAARSTIAVGFDYGGPRVPVEGGGLVARYAVGRDYHRFLGNALRAVRRDLERAGVPHGATRIGTDAVPLLERALAVRAGVGFLAKSAGVISPQLGPYLLLGEVLTPLDLPIDLPAPGSCGTCRRCLDACPTGAIVAPFEVDARRCISYTTIELRGPIPTELREPQGDWLFGCDVCLEVCPFTNRGRAAAHPAAARPPELARHAALDAFSLVGILELSEADWDARWVGTAMRRATRSGLRRNAAIVLGNLGDDAAVPSLAHALDDDDRLVRGHAAWALGRLDPRHPALERRQTREVDGWVRAELQAARSRGS
jgi:epoxyqueuosine reductase